MLAYKRLAIGIIVVTLIVGCVWYLWFAIHKNAPWEESGTLLIATRGIPTSTIEEGHSFGLTIEDISLIRDTGESVRATIRSHHVRFEDGEYRPHVVFDTPLSAGSYRGVVLTIANPEERNAWQGDTAPAPITLGGQRISLDIQFTVEPDTVTALILGFETKPAIHELNTLRTYLPVIHVESRTNAIVEKIADDLVEIRDGIPTASKMFGMDWNGAMYFNFRAHTDGTLKNTPSSTEE